MRKMSVISSSPFLGIAAEVLLAALAFLLVPYVYRSIRRLWEYRQALQKLPCDQDMHWLLGHSPKLMARGGETGHIAVQEWALEVALKHEAKVVRLCRGLLVNFVVVVHPDTAKIACGKDPKSLSYHFLRPWLGDGLLISSGVKWLRARRLLTYAFHFDVLKPYISIYADCTNVMLKLWCELPQGQPVDVIPYIRLLTIDILLKCICSLETNCQLSGSHSPYVSGVYALCNLFVERLNFFPAYSDWVYAMMPSGWKNKNTCKFLHAFSKSIITERRKQLDNEELNSKIPAQERIQKNYLDFIDVLLKAKDEDGIGLSDDEIQEQVDTFLFEGHDTTSASIIWTLYDLARFPEHQQKCRDEVDTLFDENGEIGIDDLKSLVYLKYCIKESLRLHPPVATFGRTLAESKRFGDHILPKGTPISISAYAIHHHPDVWEEPEKFDPLRFTPENSMGRSPYAYIPFSAGPRNCIGQEFAMNEERVVLAHILRKFDITLDESHPVIKTLFVILRPKDLYLVLKPRF